MDVIWSVGCVTKYSYVRSRKLIGPTDSFQIPISPKDEVIEDRDGEDVRHSGSSKDLPPIMTLQISKRYVIEMGVCPEYPVRKVVDG